MITCNENLKILTEQVRNSGDIRTAKASLLPYVTPLWYVLASQQQMFRSFFTSGGGRYRPSRFLSGRQWKCAVHCLMTTFCILYSRLSVPADGGVKAFVPYDHLPIANDTNSIIENMKLAMMFTVLLYGTETPPPFGEKRKGVDFSGKDIVRSCFLSHDPGALFRNNK